MRFPFTVVEEILEYGNRPDQPQNACIELRVTGSIDEQRLQDAVLAAMVTHPMARARKVAGRRGLRPPQWKLVEPGASDVRHVVSVARADEDTDLDTIRGSFTSHRIDLSLPPAVRLLIVRRSGGDTLLYAWHHAMADGIGGIRLLRSIVRRYAGDDDPIPDVDPLEARQLRWDGDDAAERAVETSERVTRLRDLPTLVTPSNPSERPGYGMRYRAIDVGAIDVSELRRHLPSVTANDVLLGALHLTVDEWNRLQGEEPSGRIMVMLPVSLRPASWLHEVVANVVGHGVITTFPDDRREPTALVETVSRQTERLRKTTAASFRGRPGWLRALDPFFILLLSRPSIRRRRQVASMMSNVGRLRGFEHLGSAGEITEIWGSTPASMPPGIGIGVVRHRNRIHLSVRYRHALLDAASGERFLALLVSQVERICAPVGAETTRAPAPGNEASPAAVEG